MNCQAPRCRIECDATLCPTHTRALEKTLTELPAWLAELDVTIARQDRLDGQGRAQYASRWMWSEADEQDYLTMVTLVATPMPFAWDPADLKWAAHNTLTTWVRHLCESRGLPSPTAASHRYEPASTTRWLAAHVASVAQDVAGGQAFDEITSLAQAIAKAVDRRPPRIYIGRCVEADVRFTLDGETLYAQPGICGADLYAAEGAAEATCDSCGQVWDVGERRQELLDRLDDEWATAQVIADGLTQLDVPVTMRTISQWAARSAERRRRGLLPRLHEIHQVGIDDRGRPLYRVGDVRARVEAARESTSMRHAEKQFNLERRRSA